MLENLAYPVPAAAPGRVCHQPADIRGTVRLPVLPSYGRVIHHGYTPARLIFSEMGMDRPIAAIPGPVRLRQRGGPGPIQDSVRVVGREGDCARKPAERCALRPFTGF